MDDRSDADAMYDEDYLHFFAAPADLTEFAAHGPAGLGRCGAFFPYAWTSAPHCGGRGFLAVTWLTSVPAIAGKQRVLITCVSSWASWASSSWRIPRRSRMAGAADGG
ncbi:MAG TPA: hypothetical protein VMH35_18675 [Streptosporangiaceae bacterium]|nr:hypothetical protein [Streptosporangiaceae bacterium]